MERWNLSPHKRSRVALLLLLCAATSYLALRSPSQAEGIDGRADPPTVDAFFLKSVVKNERALPPAHPFYGRRLVILDLRGWWKFRESCFPCGIPAHATEAFGKQIQAAVADDEAVVVLFGDRIKEGKILEYRRKRVFVFAPGWEAALEARTVQSAGTNLGTRTTDKEERVQHR